MERIHPHTGPKIRFYRMLRGWSLRELERYSGVGWGLIGRYEKRQTAPQYEKTGLIAKALGVTLAHLWDHTPPPSPQALAGGRRGEGGRGGSTPPRGEGPPWR